MRAYILIDTPKDKASQVVTELRSRREVRLADIINGPTPVIAVLESEDPSSIARVILFDLRRIKGIRDLTVYLSSETPGETTDGGDTPEWMALGSLFNGRESGETRSGTGRNREFKYG